MEMDIGSITNLIALRKVRKRMVVYAFQQIQMHEKGEGMAYSSNSSSSVSSSSSASAQEASAAILTDLLRMQETGEDEVLQTRMCMEAMIGEIKRMRSDFHRIVVRLRTTGHLGKLFRKFVVEPRPAPPPPSLAAVSEWLADCERSEENQSNAPIDQGADAHAAEPKIDGAPK